MCYYIGVFNIILTFFIWCFRFFVVSLYCNKGGVKTRRYQRSFASKLQSLILHMCLIKGKRPLIPSGLLPACYRVTDYNTKIQQFFERNKFLVLKLCERTYINYCNVDK